MLLRGIALFKFCTVEQTVRIAAIAEQVAFTAGAEIYRANESSRALYCVVEGRGNAVIGETRFDFSPHDVFVVPSWEPFQFTAGTDCVLFSYSDRAAQEALGFWREESH